MDATGNPPDPVARLPRRARALLWSLLVTLAIAALGFAVFRARMVVRAEVAAGYMARVVCSCRYVGMRDMASCLTDAEPGMEIVRLEEDAATRTVTARVPLIARKSAQYVAPVNGVETGCTLLN